MKFRNPLTNDQKVKVLNTIVYLTGIYTLVFHFSWLLLGLGLIAGWFLYLTGFHGSLHMYSSHRAFRPRNKFFKYLILFAGTMTGVGSNIMWAATHRKHHKYSDHEGDPHSPVCPSVGTPGLWHNIKLWFYYFPTYHINVRTVKDLTVDKEHKFFHNNYFKIHIVFVLMLALIDPVYIGYFWALPILYGYTGTNYIVVTCHLPKWREKIGYVNFPNERVDNSYNNKIAAILLPGEGNHENHHVNPGAIKNALAPGDIDLGWWWIKIIAEPKSINVNPGVWKQYYHG